jgi:hypothetical protein
MTILKYKQRKEKKMDEKDNMKKSIEKHCLECWDDDKEKVINCPYKSCPLWKYRIEKINEPRR